MSLIAWYKLDGDATDSSGNGLDGTATSVTYTGGQSGQCGAFASAASKINVANNAILQLGSTVTVACWIKVTSYQFSGIDNYVSKEAPGYVAYGFRAYGGSVRFTVNIAATDRVVGFTSPSTGVWFHVVGTYNGSTLAIYKNGVSQQTASYSGAMRSGNTDPLRIGQPPAYADRGITGFIDDVRIYDTGLTPSEVTALYNSYSYRNPSYGIASGGRLIDRLKTSGAL